MEPVDLMPLHSSSLPKLDDEGAGGAGSKEEEELGDVGRFSVGMSCSPLGFATSTGSSSSLRQPCPTPKQAAYQSYCSVNPPVKQSQPALSVSSDKDHIDGEEHDCKAESCVYLTNGYHNSGTYIVSEHSQREEAGFADFTVFAEQAAHPWCCGFTPLGSTEKLDDRVVETISSNRLREQMNNPGQEVFMDSEPRSHCAYKAKDKDCTIVRHCEKRDTALVIPSQDYHQPQEPAAALDFPSEEPNVGEKQSDTDSQRCRRHSITTFQMTEDDRGLEEDRGDTVPQTFSVYKSPPEDMVSFCDDLSFEGPSLDLEPNVSSLGSEEQTEWDQSDDEEEQLRHYSNSASFVNTRLPNLTQSKTEIDLQHCNSSATQETSVLANHSQCGAYARKKLADDCGLEHDRDPCNVQTADGGVMILGTLPPSDSFADFCTAPTQDDGEGLWEEFKDQNVQEGGRTTWRQSRQQFSSMHNDGGTEDKDRASLSSHVHQLFLASFPAVEGSALKVEEKVLSLGALLYAQHLPESEEEMPYYYPISQWIQRGEWWLHQDLHNAVGLKFHWGGSHSNRSLLRCLGLDTKKIVFIGIKKQSIGVPAFASTLCMPESTKDSFGGHSISTSRAPGHTGPVVIFDAGKLEALPSSQLDWIRHGLNSSQDGMSPRRAPHF